MPMGDKKPWDPIPPTETIDTTPMGGSKLNHPAFGQIEVSRPHGGDGVFYGTDLPAHDFVTIAVCESTQHRSLNRNWFHSGKRILELHMTPVQWAEMVSSVGRGGSTPCTLSFRPDVGVLPAIERKSDMSFFRAEMDEDISELKTMVASLRETVTQALDGAHVSKKRQAEILAPVNAIMSKLTSTLPFVEGQFAEAVERIVTEARVSIAEYAERRDVQIGKDTILALSDSTRASEEIDKVKRLMVEEE